MAITKESPIVLSLCTGLVRGLEIGIEHALQQRISVAAYAEIEAFVVENLLRGMEKGLLDAAPVYTDVKTIDFGRFRNKVHGVIGGYPCQPFSVAGNQKGAEDPRHLWPYIKNGIEAARPVFCFFENVRGHLNLGFEEVYNDLCGLGYTVRFGIYSAEEVGAPHKRERLFILAIREGQLENSNISGIRYKDREINRSHREANVQQGNWKKCSIRTFPAGILGTPDSAPTAHEVPTGRSELGIPGEELADTYNSGSWQDIKQSQLRAERIEQPSSYSWNSEQGESQEGRFFGWPTRPGQPQHEWESKRVIKPGLGCTINGYNFREDLLRGLGNGVVWQTASLAFTDLLSKF